MFIIKDKQETAKISSNSNRKYLIALAKCAFGYGALKTLGIVCRPSEVKN